MLPLIDNSLQIGGINDNYAEYKCEGRRILVAGITGSGEHD